MSSRPAWSPACLLVRGSSPVWRTASVLANASLSPLSCLCNRSTFLDRPSCTWLVQSARLGLGLGLPKPKPEPKPKPKPKPNPHPNQGIVECTWCERRVHGALHGVSAPLPPTTADCYDLLTYCCCYTTYYRLRTAATRHDALLFLLLTNYSLPPLTSRLFCRSARSSAARASISASTHLVRVRLGRQVESEGWGWACG